MTSLSDLDCLSLTIWGEARGEPIEGKVAVASVIRNRLQGGKWGRTYERVCLAPSQFSCWNPSQPTANTIALRNQAQQVMSGASSTDPVLAECYWIARGAQSGEMLDRVEGSTHYFVTSTAVPKWAVGQVPMAVVGKHSFFRGIA